MVRASPDGPNFVAGWSPTASSIAPAFPRLQEAWREKGASRVAFAEQRIEDSDAVDAGRHPG